MIITVGKRKFARVPIEGASDAAEKSKKEKLDEIFQIPQAEQKAKTGPACMQGLPKLPHCISDECYIKILKEKEDKKKKEEEEKEKRKKEHEEKAERKRIEKEQKAALKEAKKATLKGRRVRKPPKRFEQETSSSDETEPEYDDSSDTPSDDSDEFYEGTTSRCSECQEQFRGKERHEAIGCDNDICCRWYHPRCTDLDTNGKTPAQIAKMPWICKYC